MADRTTAPSQAAQTAGIWNDVTAMNWEAFRPFEALVCLPAIVLLIAGGLALGDELMALAASSGALVVGFGAFQPDFRHPAVPMALVCIGISFSAGIGTLVHAWLGLELACVALWGFGLGVMSMVGRGPGWLAMQGAIALVIAAAFPATPAFALLRFVLVLFGGAIQLIIVLISMSLAPKRVCVPQSNASVTARGILLQVAAILRGRAPGLAYATTMATAVTAGELLYRVLELPNGYWVPMTTMLILRPAARETTARTLARLLGTLIGVGLLTLLMALLRPPVPVLVGLVAVTAWTCYAFLQVNYAILSMGITMYVVLLFAIAGLPEPLVALDRTVATLLGGIIALSAHYLGILVINVWQKRKA